MTNRSRRLYSQLLCGAAMATVLGATAPAMAAEATFAIPPQSLASALASFSEQAGRPVLYRPEIANAKLSPGASGALESEVALNQLLTGTGLTFQQDGDTFLIVRASDPQSGSAAGDGADSGTVQALIVTAQKREENIQDVPIAMSAFTQEDLTRSQVAGGPDLMTQVPNFTFTKTNFSGYSIQIRGIGTQAISATTDAAVAVAFNNTPFIRNRFFEQEFYDLQRVEVLRGPQGTLYGRNATAGVVNILSQKPKFTYEAKTSLDIGNYKSHRLEGMINIPLVEDKVALRLAGAWTKRDGYDTNQITGSRIDGRDLWSTRLSLRFEPTDNIHANLIWEHFQENDDRLRSGKQLCHRDARTEIQGYINPPVNGYSAVFNQGCLAASLYSPDSFEAPNGLSLPYYRALASVALPIPDLVSGEPFDPYLSTTQSRNLRVIESTVEPQYRAKADLAQLSVNVELPGGFALTSETGYDADGIFSLEDYNRFSTRPGAFLSEVPSTYANPRANVLNGGFFCDPQVGCANRVVAVDVSKAKSRQFSQEFRLGSNYDGPFNFSLGANFLRYDTEDKYYVFINTLTLNSALPLFGVGPMPEWQPGVSDNHECFPSGFVAPDPRQPQTANGCVYIDPNPIGSLNDLGHNYFLSRNPYKLISYAAFGEAYINVRPNLKLTGGLRWTVDKKESPRIPSWVLAAETVGYPVAEVVRQRWAEPTGRLTIDWKPALTFTDETLLYASYARGYKAGGANPPPTGTVGWGSAEVAGNIISLNASKPKLFKPEYVNAFEVGTKNTLRDGSVTLNGDVFYYDYTGYQISQIIDRSAVNYNFDSTVWGGEVEIDWRALENLRVGFKGGLERTNVAEGSKAVDIMDRTAGMPGWVVVRPFPTFTSNCILPLYVVSRGTDTLQTDQNTFFGGNDGYCEFAYVLGHDPLTNTNYTPSPVSNPFHSVYPGYPGFNPAAHPEINNGEGFYKDLSGNELPNAPHFTATVTADYAVPMPNDWLMTLHSDVYYQSEAWARIFNTPGYDKLKAYTNVNLAAIFSNEDAGWKVMAYVKNVFDHNSITGAFLNSDDTGLTTNVFLNEPRLYGLRVTKEWTGEGWWTGANPNHVGPFPFTVEIGGYVQRLDHPYEKVAPGSVYAFSSAISPLPLQNRNLDWGDGRQVVLTYRPSVGPWRLSAGFQSGKANTGTYAHSDEVAPGPKKCVFLPEGPAGGFCDPESPKYEPATLRTGTNWSDSFVTDREERELADFSVGRNVGLGADGARGGVVSLGLRYAKLESTTKVSVNGVTNWDLPDGWLKYDSTHDQIASNLIAAREFKGLGPTLSWAAGQRIFGSGDSGHVNVDWAVVGGILFGNQTTQITGLEQSNHVVEKYSVHQRPQTEALNEPRPVGIVRATSVSVPTLDLSLGLSYEIQRVKVSTGYRWERYYNVLDAGFEEHKSYDRTIDGPYFKIAVGFGG